MYREAIATFKENEKYFTLNGVKHFYSEGSGPYEYLMGAFAGCFYSTLSSFGHECSWSEVAITAKGEKRTTVPTTLENTILEIVCKNCTDKEEFMTLVERTTKDCSIYQTIKEVSKIDTLVRFEDE